MKTFLVTQAIPLSKKTSKSKVVGFITTFGWEKPEEKAGKKYPHLDRFQVHEVTKKFR